MKKLAIIGANEFQNKLILKAKEMGLETHVFAWEEGAIGKKNSDYFYPISIVDKILILEKCKEINIDGICSIGSDLAMITVNYVAENMGLVGNSLECTQITTNKYEMRKVLSQNGSPCPYFKLITEEKEIKDCDFKYPVIVKPTDRSGSRGVHKINSKNELYEGFLKAQKEAFNKEIILEEFIEGKEYSVEGISQNGEHKILQITGKFTTGAPRFIEIGHEQPAELSVELKNEVERVVLEALEALGIKNGASHTELKIDNNEIKIIEVGARMGGDFIGSDLVEISTGIDFVQLVIDVALDNKINVKKNINTSYSLVRFIFSPSDIEKINSLTSQQKNFIKENFVNEQFNVVTDSSNRNGYYIFQCETKEELNDIKEVIL